MDIEGLRAATPGCMERTHLGNAGAALQSSQVLAAVSDYARLEIELGGYEAQAAAAQMFDDGRSALGHVIGSTGSHIAYAESGTLAWWRALDALHLGPGDRILVTRSEYLGTVLPLIQRGVTIDVVPDGPDGTVSIEAARAALAGPLVAAVVACHAASHAGIVNDVAGLGAAVRDESPDTWYVVDGCQSVGQIPVDVDAIRCDFLVGTGRKWLRGPRGTAFLYAGDRALAAVPERLDSNTGRLTASGTVAAYDGASRYEPWELSWSAQAGLSAAAQELLVIGADAVYQRISSLAARARAGLAELPGVTLWDRGERPGGIVSFSHSDVAAAQLVSTAMSAGISLGLVPDIAPFDPVALSGPPAVRVSAHVYNTETDVDSLLELLSDL